MMLVNEIGGDCVFLDDVVLYCVYGIVLVEEVIVVLVIYWIIWICVWFMCVDYLLWIVSIYNYNRY